MTEKQTQEQSVAQAQNTEDAWREVGRQFEALGGSLSKAVRAVWQSEETQQHVRSMQDGMEKMVDKVERAVKETRESPQGRRVRTEAEKTAETLRAAGEQTWQETQPQLLSVLKRVNAELERFTESLDQESASEGESSQSASDKSEKKTSSELQEN